MGFTCLENAVVVQMIWRWPLPSAACRARCLQPCFPDCLLREITGGAPRHVFQCDPDVAIFGVLEPRRSAKSWDPRALRCNQETWHAIPGRLPAPPRSVSEC